MFKKGMLCLQENTKVTIERITELLQLVLALSREAE